jgi:hypothetical protein
VLQIPNSNLEVHIALKAIFIGVMPRVKPSPLENFECEPTRGDADWAFWALKSRPKVVGSLAKNIHLLWGGGWVQAIVPP